MYDLESTIAQLLHLSDQQLLEWIDRHGTNKITSLTRKNKGYATMHLYYAGCKYLSSYSIIENITGMKEIYGELSSLDRYFILLLNAGQPMTQDSLYNRAVDREFYEVMSCDARTPQDITDYVSAEQAKEAIAKQPIPQESPLTSDEKTVDRLLNKDEYYAVIYFKTPRDNVADYVRLITRSIEQAKEIIDKDKRGQDIVYYNNTSGSKTGKCNDPQ